MEKRIKLVAWPNPNWKENPYQKLLTQALQKHGIDVLSTPLIFSWLPFMRKFHWLHLYWTEQLYAAKDPQKRERQFDYFLDILTRLKKRETRILWTVNNEHPHETDDREFDHQAYARIIELSDLVHVHFPAAVNVLKHNYAVDAQKIVVAPHGHYGDYYGKPIPKDEARAFFNLPKNARVILNLGYLRQYKGIEEAIDCFHEVRNPNLYFLIAGVPADPNMADYLQREAGKNRNLIMHLAKIKEREFVRFLSAADAFLFPSRSFFTSGSIMLALTYNLPVIAVPRNHTLMFLGKSFFKPWDPPSQETLTQIMERLDDWLEAVRSEELQEMKRELNVERGARKLSQRLKQI